MSELKARHIVDVYDSYYAENPFGERSQVYLKSEADKVIADLEESHKMEVEQLLIEIAELNAQVDFLKTTHDSCGSCNRCADGMGKVLNEKLDELKKKLIEQTTLRVWAEMQLHHDKYKRCLAMASYWVAVSYQCVDDKHRQKAEKRHYKWLELAEKFKDKEAK
jgi:hypothetical protein